MKLPSSHTVAYCLITGLVLLCLHGCDKRDETPMPKAEPVVIPDSDRLQPLKPTNDTPPPDTTAVIPSDPEPEAIPTRPEKSNTLKIPNFSQQTPPGHKLALRFLATGESFYTEMKLADGIFSYTYFEDTHGRCEKWVKSSPCWQTSDLKTISMALPNADLDNLYSVIKDSGILTLKRETFGGAKTGQRYYTQRLDVSIDGKQKQLIYQSFPGSSKKPEAFARLETALLEYARDLPH